MKNFETLFLHPAPCTRVGKEEEGDTNNCVCLQKGLESAFRMLVVIV